MRAAALKGLEGEIDRARPRAHRRGDEDIHLSEHGRLWWSGAAVGRLTAGPHPLTPVVELIADELLKGDLRDAVQARLTDWVAAHIASVLDPLMPLRKPRTRGRCPAADVLPGPARGLAFQLAEALGSVERTSPALPEDIRSAANAASVRRARGMALRLSAAADQAGSVRARGVAMGGSRQARAIPPPPQPGLTSFAVSKNDEFEVPDAFLSAAFYRRLGARAVRLDILERVETALFEGAKRKTNADEVMNVLDLGARVRPCGDALALVALLGWRRETHEIKSGGMKTDEIRSLAARTKTDGQKSSNVQTRRSSRTRRLRLSPG